MRRLKHRKVKAVLPLILLDAGVAPTSTSVESWRQNLQLVDLHMGLFWLIFMAGCHSKAKVSLNPNVIRLLTDHKHLPCAQTYREIRERSPDCFRLKTETSLIGFNLRLTSHQKHMEITPLSGHLLLHPASRRPHSRPSTCWRDYISCRGTPSGLPGGPGECSSA